MASSLETTVPPESTHMGSPPPSHSPSPPPPLQGDHSLPTGAPPKPSPQPHHATPILPPSPGQATKERPRVEEPQPPIDGTPGAAGPPTQPSFFPSLLELGSSAAPSAPAATRQPSSPSPHPPAEPSVEFYPRSAASSPSSSYETAEDDWPAPPLPTPPPLVLCASLDSSYTESSPARDRFSEEEGSHAAPEPPPLPPSEIRPRGICVRPGQKTTSRLPRQHVKWRGDGAVSVGKYPRLWDVFPQMFSFTVSVS
uniref:Uncharacterized protein n=1 Tax=Oryza barthii TaxID=65489 RepID=A0A0D3GI88_9ORYZ